MPCTPKKTIDLILDTENDYLITVKANQGNLYQSLVATFAQTPPWGETVQEERSHGRQICRTIRVLPPPADLHPDWRGIQSVIQAEYSGYRGDKPYHEVLYYITSLDSQADDLAHKIRQHWQIENCLHWVKDVVMKEDESPMCDGYALTNWAIVRTFALNLLRAHGFNSLTKAFRLIAHDLLRIFSFFQ